MWVIETRLGRLSLGPLLVVLALGCDGEEPVDPDGGAEEDAGMDAGRPPSRDAGDAGCVCEVMEHRDGGGVPALPSCCLPRCAMATDDCVDACPDLACENDCLAADTTEPTPLAIGGGDVIDLDCQGCFEYQRLGCEYRVCPTEVARCLTCPADRCDRTTPGCETEESELDACLDENMADFAPCAVERTAACFAR
jgi:hypothetical protein